jgi:hypothetical protein
MYYKGTLVPGVSAHSVSALRVSAFRLSVPSVAVFIVGIALLASPSRMLAQRGGGGGESGEVAADATRRP